MKNSLSQREGFYIESTSQSRNLIRGHSWRTPKVCNRSENQEIAPATAPDGTGDSECTDRPQKSSKSWSAQGNRGRRDGEVPEERKRSGPRLRQPPCGADRPPHASGGRRRTIATTCSSSPLPCSLHEGVVVSQPSNRLAYLYVIKQGRWSSDDRRSFPLRISTHHREPKLRKRVKWSF